MAGSHEVRGSIPLGSTKKTTVGSGEIPGPTCVSVLSARASLLVENAQMAFPWPIRQGFLSRLPR